MCGVKTEGTVRQGSRDEWEKGDRIHVTSKKETTWWVEEPTGSEKGDKRWVEEG